MKNLTNKEVYEKTLEMFKGCCVYCGSPYIHMHHIRYGGLHGGRKTYMGNVIPLCKKHHRMVHSDKDRYMNELIDIVNKRIDLINKK